MAINESATSRCRSRFELAPLGRRWALALACVIGPIGCGDDGRADAQVVAQVDGIALDRRVVEAIAAREGISATEAEARALDQLRYVAARRAELDARETPPEHPDDLDPARRTQLERAAMVRLWLTQVFEPAHDADDIPQRVVEQNLADPSVARRLFHPELWFICQVLIVPAQQGEDGRSVQPPDPEQDPDAAAQWFADANLAFAPIAARIEGIAPEILGENRCEVLGRVVGASEREFDTPSGPMLVRFERVVFEGSAARLDQTWLAAVTETRAPGLVAPRDRATSSPGFDRAASSPGFDRAASSPGFPTRFGVHLVFIDKIEASELADGSQPPKQLAAAREAKLRDEIVEPYRAEQLQQLLIQARDRRVVRRATGLE
jgi:hypothetical protein